MAGSGTRPSTLDVDGFRIELKRGNQRTMRLGVRHDGTFRMSAPWSTKVSDLEAFVRSHKGWLLTTRDAVRARQAPTEDLGHGGRVLFWGRWLEVERTYGPKPRADIIGDRVQIDAFDDDAALRAMARLRRREIEASVAVLAPHWENMLGKEATGYRFREMTSRWGTCNTRTGWITINTWLVQREEKCLQYVLAHELAHLFERGHGSIFQTVMDFIFPGWRQTQSELRSTAPPRR